MATQGTYLVNNTANNVIQLLQQLLAVHTTVVCITERMAAAGQDADSILEGYTWPEGYTKDDFTALYQALNGLPNSVVSNDVRNELHRLVRCIQ